MSPTLRIRTAATFGRLHPCSLLAPTTVGRISLCVLLTAPTVRAWALQDAREGPRAGEAAPGGADSAGLTPAGGPGWDPDRPSKLRLTPKDLSTLEHRLQELRERSLELRAERAHLEDELRRLGDVQGSLDEAMSGPASPALDASRRRQEVEERARALQERLGSLEAEERGIGHAQAEIQKLLQELRPKPPPRAISARRFTRPGTGARSG